MLRLATIAAAGLLTACSSATPNAVTSEESTTTSAATTTSVAAAPSVAPPTTIPADRPPDGAPVVLKKQLGERAGTGCPTDPNARCDVYWAINSIIPNAPCVDEYGAPLNADQQLLQFDIEIWTEPQFNFPDYSASAFFLDNWGVRDEEGVDTNLDSPTGVRCNGQLTGDQIQKSLLPGTHMTKTVFFVAPKDATVIRLYGDERGEGWTWDIPR